MASLGADGPRLLPDGRLPGDHDVARARLDALDGHAVVARAQGQPGAAGRDGRRHAVAARAAEVHRLEVGRARQPFLARVQDLGDLEVRQAVDAVVRVRHGVPRRLLGAPGAGGGAAAVGPVVAGAAVAGLEAYAREHVREQRAQRDEAGADDAHVDLDDAEVGDGGAVPRHIDGQGGPLDREDAGDGYHSRAARSWRESQRSPYGFWMIVRGSASYQKPRPKRTVSTILCLLCSCRAQVAGIGTATTAKFVTMFTADDRDQTKRLCRQVPCR